MVYQCAQLSPEMMIGSRSSKLCDFSRPAPSHHKRAVKKFPLATLYAALFMGTLAHAQNLVMNAGFEQPPTGTAEFLTFNPGDVTLPGWQIIFGGVDVVHQNFFGSPAYEGVQYLDLDGSPGPGGITQEIATTPGVPYEFSFAYANNPTSANPTTFASARIYDSSGNVFEPVIFSHSTSVLGNLNWSFYTTIFTATQAVTQLEYLSFSPTPSSGGMLLDKISIVAIPEPFGFALLALSTMGWGLFRRRRSLE